MMDSQRATAITAECSRCHKAMTLDVPAGSDIELAVKLSHLVVCAVCSQPPREASTPKEQAQTRCDRGCPDD
jgi:hypothetical protein